MRPVELRAILDACGLTQRALSELINVSPQTPMRWLSGAAPIPTGTALFLRFLQNGRIGIEEAQAMRLHYEPD